jgi:hypothetical protein
MHSWLAKLNYLANVFQHCLVRRRESFDGVQKSLPQFDKIHQSFRTLHKTFDTCCSLYPDDLIPRATFHSPPISSVSIPSSCSRAYLPILYDIFLPYGSNFFLVLPKSV